TQWIVRRWNALPAHHQQSFFGVILLALSLVLFGSLTIFRTSHILAPLNKFLLDFCGWSAYPLAIGLVALALAYLIEGIRNQHIITWRTIIGLGILWLLVLAESRLLFGPVGILGELLVYPLQGWPTSVGHVVLIGLIIVVTILTFRIRFGHVLLTARFLQRLISDSPRGDTAQTSAPSPFLGQRPQYSRYVGNAASSSATPARQGEKPATRSRQRPLPDENDDADADATIAFEADFDAQDPLDDINIHKQQVGNVPRGPRAPRVSDGTGVPVRNANQQALPFDGEENDHKLILKPAKSMDK